MGSVAIAVEAHPVAAARHHNNHMEERKLCTCAEFEVVVVRNRKVAPAYVGEEGNRTLAVDIVAVALTLAADIAPGE